MFLSVFFFSSIGRSIPRTTRPSRLCLPSERRTPWQPDVAGRANLHTTHTQETGNIHLCKSISTFSPNIWALQLHAHIWSSRCPYMDIYLKITWFLLIKLTPELLYTCGKLFNNYMILSWTSSSSSSVFSHMYIIISYQAGCSCFKEIYITWYEMDIIRLVDSSFL